MVGYTSDKACQRLHATQRGSSTIINIYLFLLWQCRNDIGIDAVTIDRDCFCNVTVATGKKVR